MTISELDYPPPISPVCPASLLGGCTAAATDCAGGAAGACIVGMGSYDPNCYNGDITQKVVNGCGAVPTDCACLACPTGMVGGCMHAYDCPGGASAPCSPGSNTFSATCYNGAVAHKSASNCGTLQTDCMCSVG